MEKTQFISARKKFQEEHRRLGLCYDCNNRPDAGKTRCASCMEKRRLSDKKRRHSAKASGVCVHCCHNPKLNTHRLCEDCYLKRTSQHRLGTTQHWEAIKHRFQAQEGKCALSGVSLTMGVDAELDHIIPSSRGGTSEPSNTQWVLCVVNRMKDHMVESEFFGLVEKLYFTMKGMQEETP